MKMLLLLPFLLLTACPGKQQLVVTDPTLVPVPVTTVAPAPVTQAPTTQAPATTQAPVVYSSCAWNTVAVFGPCDDKFPAPAASDCTSPKEMAVQYCHAGNIVKFVCTCK